MADFTLEHPEYANVLASLIRGQVCRACTWQPNRNGWSRADTDLTFDKLRMTVVTRLEGGTVRYNGQTWSLRKLSPTLRSHVKAVINQRVEQCSVVRDTSGASRANIELLFENGVTLSLEARPLLDTICVTDEPFTQYVGAAPIDSARLAKIQANPTTSVPGFVPMIPERTRLRVVQCRAGG